MIIGQGSIPAPCPSSDSSGMDLTPVLEIVCFILIRSMEWVSTVDAKKGMIDTSVDALIPYQATFRQGSKLVSNQPKKKAPNKLYLRIPHNAMLEWSKVCRALLGNGLVIRWTGEWTCVICSDRAAIFFFASCVYRRGPSSRAHLVYRNINSRVRVHVHGLTLPYPNILGDEIRVGPLTADPRCKYDRRHPYPCSGSGQVPEQKDKSKQISLTNRYAYCNFWRVESRNQFSGVVRVLSVPWFIVKVHQPHDSLNPHELVLEHRTISWVTPRIVTEQRTLP